jgi:hypothetical protein
MTPMKKCYSTNRLSELNSVISNHSNHFREDYSILTGNKNNKNSNNNNKLSKYKKLSRRLEVQEKPQKSYSFHSSV